MNDLLVNNQSLESDNSKSIIKNSSKKISTFIYSYILFTLVYGAYLLIKSSGLAYEPSFFFKHLAQIATGYYIVFSALAFLSATARHRKFLNAIWYFSVISFLYAVYSIFLSFYGPPPLTWLIHHIAGGVAIMFLAMLFGLLLRLIEYVVNRPLKIFFLTCPYLIIFFLFLFLFLFVFVKGATVDTKDCASLSGDHKAACFTVLAKKTNNLELCAEAIRGSYENGNREFGSGMEHCVKEIISNLSEKNIFSELTCEKLSNEEIKSMCYWKMATDDNNSFLCEKVTISKNIHWPANFNSGKPVIVDKNDCYTRIAIKNHDASLCKKLDMSFNKYIFDDYQYCINHTR